MQPGFPDGASHLRDIWKAAQEILAFTARMDQDELAIAPAPAPEVRLLQEVELLNLTGNPKAARSWTS